MITNEAFIYGSYFFKLIIFFNYGVVEQAEFPILEGIPLENISGQNQNNVPSTELFIGHHQSGNYW